MGMGRRRRGTVAVVVAVALGAGLMCPVRAGEEGAVAPGPADAGEIREAAEQAPAGEANADPARRLFGRVVDREGRPIHGARVTAKPSLRGGMRFAPEVCVRTDKDGRFAMTVPFEGVWYDLEALRTDYWGGRTPAMAGNPDEIVIATGSGPRGALPGTVIDQLELPAAGARVVLAGQFGHRWEVETDAAGRFRIEDLSGNMRQSVIYAELFDTVSPYKLLRGPGGAALTLGAPARLTGVVTEKQSGKLLPDCTVTARPYFASGLTFAARTDGEGRFAFKQLPPGRYSVVASHAEFFDPPRGSYVARGLPLEAGKEAAVEIALLKKATIRGRVLRPDGEPAPGVPVAVLGAIRQENVPEYWRITRAGADGRFVIRTDGLHGQRTLYAFCVPHGGDHAAVEGLAEGEVRDDVTIRLAGAMRVRGTVKDHEARPVAGVPILWGTYGAPRTTTDAEGRFDLGWAPLSGRPDGEDYVAVHAPGPRCGNLKTMGEDKLLLFHHRKVAIEPQPAKEIAVDVALEPAELLTLTGRVLDADGEPVAAADVVLLGGKADVATWLEAAFPDWGAGPGSLRITSRLVAAQSSPLCRTTTGGQGRWTFRVVRESAEDCRVAPLSRRDDAGHFSVGARAKDGRSGLIADITFKDDETRKTVDITLGAPPAPEPVMDVD